jgi:hypothetical protein
VFAVLGDQQNKKGDNFMKNVVQRMCMGCNTKKDKKESKKKKKSKKDE